MNKNFAIIGVGGYIAPRHLEAIKVTGNKLVVAYDVIDSVGIIDRYAPDAHFFTDFEKFETFVESLKGTKDQIDYVSICSPNHLHYAHMQFALRHNANAICEKPLVLTVAEIENLKKKEAESKGRISTILQLRVHDAIKELKAHIEKENRSNHQIDLTYITSRGRWYHESWKGDVKKSGGLITNIGVHFFDMLTWIFGNAKEITLQEKNDYFAKGTMLLDKATVNWSMAVDSSYLPEAARLAGKTTFRSLKIDGNEFEFSEGFTELHNRVYEGVLKGEGFGLEASKEAIRIVEKLREL